MPRELPRTDNPYGSAPGPSWRPDTMISVGRTEGTLSRRLWAYLIDIVMIALFSLLLCGAILIIGLLTFGLGWGLFGRRSQLRFYRRIGERVRERAVLEPPGRRISGTGPLVLVPGDAGPDPWDHARIRVAHPVRGRRLLLPAADRT